jgi:PmbA protein
MERTDAWAAVVALAERDGETQTGFSFRLLRGPDELALDEVAVEAASRAARLLGGTKPTSERLPVVLDPVAASSFLGVLSGALSAESVLKGRSLLADLVTQTVASDVVSVIDDGRLIEGPAVAPFDDEGVATGRTALIDRGTLRGFLHNTYTATRAGASSTGNAGRASYRSAPGVSPSNLFLEPGPQFAEALIAGVERGVYVQDVTGLHSGANPITGQFSVGATGLRIASGALADSLREMTIASTLLDVLRAISAVGSDLRFFPGGTGSPTVLVGEMTVAGT